MKYLMLFLLFALPRAANAQTVNGSLDAAFAVGKWKETREGVSLFWAHVTNPNEVTKGKSEGACFLTEAEASAKDSVKLSTSMFRVTAWDEHSL